MSNLLITIFAYLIDKIFGEFRFIKHPVVAMGEMITFFEKRYYKDSVIQGFYLVMFMLVSIAIASTAIYQYLEYLPSFINIIISSLIASIFISHRMLYDSVKAVLTADDKKQAISMLVSRDTADMNESDIYKASIETYAENLSDGVVAPMFYLLLFGLPGIILYKTINTMDSMVGYRNEKYENYGKVAAILDDVVNFIPSRITAVLIMLLGSYRPTGQSLVEKDIFSFYENGQKHESPNAGHPITAMALVLGVKLGGDTSYFGEVKKKAHFGVGREIITKDDVLNAINLGRYWKNN